MAIHNTIIIRISFYQHTLSGESHFNSSPRLATIIQRISSAYSYFGLTFFPYYSSLPLYLPLTFSRLYHLCVLPPLLHAMVDKGKQRDSGDIPSSPASSSAMDDSSNDSEGRMYEERRQVGNAMVRFKNQADTGPARKRKPVFHASKGKKARSSEDTTKDDAASPCVSNDLKQ